MSDIDVVVVDSLKALDPERPIREAEVARVLNLVGFVTTPMNTKGAGVVEAASVTQCPLRPRLLDVSQADNPSEVGKSSRGQFSFCLAALDFPGVSF